MATNRLFIYDKETNTALCIAKGYSNGWRSSKQINNNVFFDKINESTGCLENGETRLELKTEDNLPKKCEITWQTEKP